VENKIQQRNKQVTATSLNIGQTTLCYSPWSAPWDSQIRLIKIGFFIQTSFSPLWTTSRPKIIIPSYSLVPKVSLTSKSINTIGAGNPYNAIHDARCKHFLLNLGLVSFIFPPKLSVCLIRHHAMKTYRKVEGIHSFTYTSMALQPLVGPWPLFQFRNLFQTDGSTPWTSDPPVARPLPTHRPTQTQIKRRQATTPRLGFEPTTPAFERAKWVRALDRAAGYCDRWSMIWLKSVTNKSWREKWSTRFMSSIVHL
jgi:hypothetical protein